MEKRNEDYSALLDVKLLKKLVVGIGEVSKITGIPIRKIRYWEEKGIIHSQNNKGGTTRRYDYIKNTFNSRNARRRFHLRSFC